MTNEAIDEEDLLGVVEGGQGELMLYQVRRIGNEQLSKGGQVKIWEVGKDEATILPDAGSFETYKSTMMIKKYKGKKYIYSVRFFKRGW